MSPRRSPVRKALAHARTRLLGNEVAELRRELGVLSYESRVQHQLVRVALGTLMAQQVAGAAKSVEGAQFGAFSQFGEDGIIEYLIQQCNILPQSFIEIGVETYAESNTRFLAEHRLWRGLIIDQDPRLGDNLAATQLHWRSQLSAVSSFVTRENARTLVEPFLGGCGLGLLSVDIDGVDYWILEQLVDLDAAMVIVEYNALFGDVAAVSVPYDPSFDRTAPERHNIYYGASLAAYQHLLGNHGYSLVGCTLAGNNAFFVKTGRLGAVPAQSVKEAFKPRRFVEHRTLDGSLTGLVDLQRQLDCIADKPLVRVTDATALRVADLPKVVGGNH